MTTTTTISNATSKNLNREAKYSFANINLLGKCNADCYFCLGKDIEPELAKYNLLNTHFSEWENFETFLNKCEEYGVQKIYLTGENTDPLIYTYLGEIIDYVQERGFDVGIRNNGYLALKNMKHINRCRDEIGYSVNAISPEANYKLMKKRDLPKWERIIPATNNPRTSIIVSRYNEHEFLDIVKFLSQFDNIRYIQARCIVSETRHDEMVPDQEAFQRLHQQIQESFPLVDTFHGAMIYEIYGTKVSFWKNWDTNINSFNYFSNGVISESCFIIKGYLENQKTPQS